VLAFFHEDIADDALFGGLDDLEVALREEFAFGAGDDIQLAEDSPDQQQPQQGEQAVQQGARERRGRLRLECAAGRGRKSRGSTPVSCFSSAWPAFIAPGLS
jgi:hypothetical protein